MSKPLVLKSANWPGMVRDEQLYAEVLALLQRTPGPYTLSHLVDALQRLGREAGGNGELSLAGRDNAVVAWGASIDTVTVISMLIADPAVKVWHCKANLYPLKQARMPMPIAHQIPAKDFPRRTWVPIAFDFKRHRVDR